MATGYTDLILTRDLQNTTSDAAWPFGFQCLTVESEKDPAFTRLDEFCVSNGFPNGWAAHMLAANRHAWLIVAQDNAKHEDVSAAVGWTSHDGFFIDEIERTFTPGPEGIYLFGDFVGKTWRGRRLQQLLIRERVRWSVLRGARWAYAITRDNNKPSVRNYTEEGFAISADIRVRFLGPFRFDHYSRPTPSVPAGSVSVRGAWLPLGWRIRRGKCR